MKIIYISSPYTVGDVAANVTVQLEAAHKIMDWGHAPVAPLLSHYLHIHRQRAYEDYIHCQRAYEDWLQLDLALIPKMDIVLRLPGESKGADREVALAQLLNVPVAFGWDALASLLAA